MSFERLRASLSKLSSTEGDRAPLDENGHVLKVVGQDKTTGKLIYEPTGKLPLTRQQVRAATRAEFSAQEPDLEFNVLANAATIIPGYDKTALAPASERSKRAALSEKARDALLDYAEEWTYDDVPSQSPLAQRPDGPMQRFVQHVLGLDLDDPALGGVSLNQMRASTDPRERQRFYVAAIKIAAELLEDEVSVISSLTDEEAVARYARTMAFYNILWEAEAYFGNEKLNEVAEVRYLRDVFKRNQSALAVATERVELIANPLYCDLSIEKTLSCPMEGLTAVGAGLESADSSPAGLLRADFFKEAGLCLHAAQMQRAEYLCNLLRFNGFDPEAVADSTAAAFIEACGVQALLPDGQQVTGVNLQEMMNGQQPLLLELPAHDDRPAELVSVIPGNNIFDVRLNNNYPEMYFNFAAENRIASLTQLLLDADKRVFNGSKEFASMAHAMTMLGEHFVNLQNDGRGYQQIKDLLDELNERSTEYLKFKESQRGLQDDGTLVGKNNTEQRRIEAAQQVQSFVQEKLGQLQLLTGNSIFKETMTAKESDVITNAADAVSKAESPSQPLSALENAAARSARELRRMAQWGDALSPAEKADARMHMARLVVNEVVHLQGDRGPMMSLYNQSPAKLCSDYANSKEFKAIADDPEKIRAFMETNGAKTMAEGIVSSLAAKMNDAPKAQPQQQPKEISAPAAPQMQ